MAEVTIWEMVKRYGRVTAVDNISLRIPDGELMVLLGPSGCGKTTTLRSIAGLEHPESGEIIIGSRRVKALPPADRDIAFVFQFYALYPHLNVFDNIAFALQLHGDRRKSLQRARDRFSPPRPTCPRGGGAGPRGGDLPHLAD